MSDMRKCSFIAFECIHTPGDRSESALPTCNTDDMYTFAFCTCNVKEIS